MTAAAPMGGETRSLAPRIGLLAALTALALAPVPREAVAGCAELLRVEREDSNSAPPLTLSDCHVSAQFEGHSLTAPVILRLKEPAAQAWRAGLAPNGLFATALAGGKLMLRPSAGSLPKAPLLPSLATESGGDHAWRWNASSATLRIDPPDPALGAVDARCPTWIGGGPLLWMDTLEVPPGALIAPSAYWTTRPGRFDPIAPACLSGWSLGEDAPAVIHAGLGLVNTAPDAPEGAVFEISARVAGQSQPVTVRAAVRVTDPTRHPLAGIWSEIQEKSCDGGDWRKPAEPFGELVFKADGAFTLARAPFESYFDYWGTYRHAPATGALALNITGGNRIPSERSAKGKARVMPSGDLLLEGLPPWSAEAGGAVCSRLFRRH